LLVESFLARHAARRGRRVLGFTPVAVAALAAYDFPGNVRELENEVERAVMLAEDGGYVTPDLLSPKLAGIAVADEPMAGSLRESVERYEAQLVREGLARHDGNQTRTATE